MIKPRIWTAEPVVAKQGRERNLAVGMKKDGSLDPSFRPAEFVFPYPTDIGCGVVDW
jgi:hypothetical protein